MDESWGLKGILDASDDVAVFVVSERDDTILYCNYLVNLKTGRHASSPFSGMWEECREHMKMCGDGRTYRFFAADTPFGKNKNVTITRTVWQTGESDIKSYTFMVSSHTESKEEREREIIFKALGQSYLSIRILRLLDENPSVETIFHNAQKNGYFKPMSFEEWRESIIENYAFRDDIDNIKKCLERQYIQNEIDDEEGLSIQFRRKCGDEYRWTEMHIAYLSDEKDRRIICTEKDIHGDLAVNKDNLNNDLIMKSLTNIYRSVYLLDLNTGDYTTVKPDQLLFGIPGEGVYDELMMFVLELIPDAAQKKDFNEYFSLEAIKNAFAGDTENIGREYNSTISENMSWMSVSVFRTPSKKGLENKCVITFMDVTEHKRVEAERNENSIAIDVLSSRYVALFFIDGADYTYHAIRIPQQYRYLEKQYSKLTDAFNHYVSCYVLDEYKEGLRNYIDLSTFKTSDSREVEKQEYVFKNVNDQWIRLSLTKVPEEQTGRVEYIMAFEDYNDVMETFASSSIYSKMLLADYDEMYEYDIAEDAFYELAYDGSKLVRDYSAYKENGGKNISPEVFVREIIHPDDLFAFSAACSRETIDDIMSEGKTVSHLMIRRRTEEGYHHYMYGFHYFQEFGKRTVLVLARDADKELV